MNDYIKNLKEIANEYDFDVSVNKNREGGFYCYHNGELTKITDKDIRTFSLSELLPSLTKEDILKSYKKHRRLRHLNKYAKTQRKRKKNMKRFWG